MGSIRKNEAALEKLADTIPVTGQVTNATGSMQIGLEITSRRMDELLTSGIKDALYTSQAGGNIEAINQVEPVRDFIRAAAEATG